MTHGTAASAAAAVSASETKTSMHVTCSRGISTFLAGAIAEHVRDRDRVYEIDGAESRALATIGAFRVVAESDLHDIRDDSQTLAAKPQASREGRTDSHVTAQLRRSRRDTDGPRT